MRYLSWCSSLDATSLDKLFASICTIITFIGLPVNKSVRTKCDVCLALAAFCPVLLFVVFQVVSALTHTHDPAFVGTCLLILTSNINAIPKFITFVVRVRELRALRSIVRQHTAAAASSLPPAADVGTGTGTSHAPMAIERTQPEAALLLKYTRVAALTTAVIAGSFLLAFVAVIVAPYAFSLATGGHMNPLKVKIPALSDRTHPGYDVHMALTHYVIAYLIVIRAATDLFFFYCTLYAAYQFEVCKSLVSTLGAVGSAPASAADHRQLQRVVNVHRHVFRFCRLCGRTFEWIIFFEVASIASTLVVALTMRDTSPMLFTFSIQLTTGQFFIFCLFAELVNSKGTETSEAIYMSCWYNVRDPRTRKEFLFLLACSQYDLSFNAFGLIKLSLETFVNVLKAAFSYYTFMQSVL